MGAVDSGICCFLGSASKFRFISETGIAHGGAAWKNWGDAMELNFSGKSVV